MGGQMNDLKQRRQLQTSLPGPPEALGATLEPAARPRPGMQPAGPHPARTSLNQLRGRGRGALASSPWRPSRAPSRSGLLPANSLPAGAAGALAARPRDPGGSAAAAPGLGPEAPQPPTPHPVWLHLQPQNGCLCVSFQGHLCPLRPQAPEVLDERGGQTQLRVGNSWRLPEKYRCPDRSPETGI